MKQKPITFVGGIIDGATLHGVSCDDVCVITVMGPSGNDTDYYIDEGDLTANAWDGKSPHPKVKP
jgi:hypothetical protein